MTKKEEQYEARRGQLLDIGLRHFIQYGFYGTSTRKIAEEAGISSGLMFHYYPNKLALYEALVKIGCEAMSSSDSGECAPEESSPLDYFEEKLDRFLSIMLTNSFSSKMFIFMGLAAINAKEISKTAFEMIKEHDIISLSVPYIKKGQKAGLIRQGDPCTLASVFYNSIQGFAEVLNTRNDLKLPEKEWFMAILKNPEITDTASTQS